MIKDTLVLFDIDGTLLFSEKVDSECFAATFKEQYGADFPTIDWTYFSHVTDHTIFREAYFKLHGSFPDLPEIERFRNLFVDKIQEARRVRPEAFQMVPGANMIFEYLLEKEIPFGVATGGWHAPATAKLKHVGLWHEGLVLSAADQQPTRVDIINRAKEGCRIKGYHWEKVVYIGDAIWDVKTCREMEIPLLGIKIKGDHKQLLDAGASHVISNYESISDFFEKLNKIQVPL